MSLKNLYIKYIIGRGIFMKKTLVAICCVITMVLAIPFASYAREASDTTLFINSDSTDIYSNSVKKEMSKTFDSRMELSDMSDWDATGKFVLGDEGIEFGSETVSFVYNEKTFDGKYTVKGELVNKYPAVAKVFFNYQNSKNTYYVSIDAVDGSVVLGKIVSGSDQKLVSLKIPELKISVDGQSTNIEFSIISDKGDNISVDLTVGGNNFKIAENLAVSGAKLTSGKAGVGFEYVEVTDAPIFKNMTVYSLPYEDVSNVSNTIKGKIVSYKDSGDAVLAVAFYEDGNLYDIFTKNISFTKGFNDFTIDIESEKNLLGKEIKYFLFDSLSNVKPLVVTGDNSSYRENGFSDKLEPYYPMSGTYTKTTDEMYDLISGGIYSVLSNSTAKENADRLAVIDMYRKAGFDLTADMSTSVASKIMKNHAPQTYSTLTPKPLMGDYEQSYSIDAPWNNPIPKGNPKTKITSWIDTENKSIVSFQFATVLPKGATSGNGLGIPIIIADENDGFETFAYSYGGSNNPWYNAKGHNVRVPENYSDMLNNISYADRHAVFIDDTTKTSIQTWHTVPSDSPIGYDWATGLIKDFDARSGSFTSIIDLTGMANEDHAGVNAAGIPMDAITLKKSDITDPDSDITHALGAALGTMMKARVYPAYDVDSDMFKDVNAVGCVPYGGIIQLDPSIDLEGIYDKGLLSLPAYKILKAWRDYGLYNVDRSTSGISRGSMLIYTSTKAEDWTANGAKGVAAVEAEMKSFLKGEIGGLSEPVSFYVTIPVVKHTSYDANGDESVTDADASFINENIGEIITMDNVDCDVNKDGEITERDAELVEKYLDAEAPQNPKTYTISGEYLTANQVGVGQHAGVVNITANHATPINFNSERSYQIREGEYYSVAAIPGNGYVFAGWENEELKDIESNVITTKATKDIHYAADFVRAPEVEVTVEKNEDGEGTVYLATGKDNNFYKVTAYGENDEIKYGYGVNDKIKYGNWQCAFKAEPAEGYVFDSWEVTADGNTKTYHSSVLNTYINSDTNIKANFKKANILDKFDTLDTSVWTPVGTNTTMYGNVSNGTLTISGNDLWGKNEYVIINNNASSSGNTTLRVTVTAKKGLQRGLVVFGYNKINEINSNYWIVEIDSTYNEVRLKQRKDGNTTTVAEFIPSITDSLDISRAAHVYVKTTLDGKISVYIYQDDSKYTIVEGYDAGSVVTGYAGLGTANGSGWTYDDFAIIPN